MALKLPRAIDVRPAQIVEFATDAIISKDRAGMIVSWNRGAERIYGYRAEEVVGKPISLIIPDDLKGEEWELLLRVLGGERIEFYETLRRAKDGRIVNVSLTLFALHDADGAIIGAASIAHDITDHVNAEHEHRVLEGRHHQILESADEGIWYVDGDGVTEYANPRMATMLGYAPGEMIGRPVIDFIGEKHLLNAREIMERQSRGVRERTDLSLLRRDGSELPVSVSVNAVLDDGGARTGYLAIVSDVSRQREMESELQRTESFLEGVSASMHEGMLTLDSSGRIATVNAAALGSLGYASGELLGATLCEGFGCRRGELLGLDIGDCGLHRINASIAPMRLDDELLICADGAELPVSLSAAPLGGDSPGTAGHIVIFHDVSERRAAAEQAQRELEEMSWVGRLSDAMDEDRLLVAAQPIVSLASRDMTGRELLVRVRARDGSLVLPAKFLPAAERYGLIGELDRWMIVRAARLAAAGQNVNVNLSAQSLGDPQLKRHVERALADAGADPGRITFEITETALTEHLSLATDFTTHVAELGCEFALDDFGTGYGAFTYLKTLPIKYLKIDIEFVRDLLQSKASEHLVSATVQLAQGFGQLTVAEGVEDEATLDRLRELDVDLVQGFFVGRPEVIPTERLGRIRDSDHASSPAA
jgi:PAS domain S-box-containing protein